MFHTRLAEAVLFRLRYQGRAHLADTVYQHFLIGNGLLCRLRPMVFKLFAFCGNGRVICFLCLWRNPFSGGLDMNRKSVSDRGGYVTIEIWSGQYFSSPFPIWSAVHANSPECVSGATYYCFPQRWPCLLYDLEPPTAFYSKATTGQHLLKCTQIIRSVILQKVDNAPYGKACAKSYNKSL